MTRKIMPSTTQAARVWKPKNRGLRPSLCGAVADPDHRERRDPRQHPDAEQVLDESDERPVADAGDREGPGEQVTGRTR